MEFWVLLLVFLLSSSTYMLITSYKFQVFLRKRSTKKFFLDTFVPRVKGSFLSEGYYASSHRLIQPKDYFALNPNNRANFSKCYNAVTFKTQESHWELYFYLVKDGVKFSEVLVMRSFPKHLKIRSEGHAEKVHSRVNILTNNRYLTQILESAEVKELLRWILKNPTDSLYVHHNNLHFRSVQTKENKMTPDRAMEVVKGIHNIKNRIFKKGVLEY